jgi:hypothetical protein
MYIYSEPRPEHRSCSEFSVLVPLLEEKHPIQFQFHCSMGIQQAGDIHPHPKTLAKVISLLHCDHGEDRGAGITEFQEHCIARYFWNPNMKSKPNYGT